jgi:hypothetical protein
MNRNGAGACAAGGNSLSASSLPFVVAAVAKPRRKMVEGAGLETRCGALLAAGA